MILSRQRHIGTLCNLVLMILLAGCGASTAQNKPAAAPPPSPTPVQGQQLLQSVGKQLNTAKTLHGIFNLTVNGGNISGTTSSEVWRETPAKSRNIVLQSSITQIASGTTTVSDGKQLWLYDPQKQVVYHGAVGTGTNGATSTGQLNQLANLERTVFTQSSGTMGPQTNINGHAAYDIHVVPSATSSSQSNYDYTGDVYIDKATQLPLRIKLTLQNLGQVQLDFSNLTLNQPIAAQTFVFTVPNGVKVQPLPAANSSAGGTGSLTLDQAQKQAGYHLLSISASQAGYTLQEVTALGAPGSQIYTLTYLKGTTELTIAQGKPLANLPATGQQVSLRGTNGTLASADSTTTLSWTEKGVGVRINSQLASAQILQLAQQLS